MAIVAKESSAAPLVGPPSNPDLRVRRIPKERYVSRDFQEIEAARLWPRVWQMACREEEIPNPGDFIEHRLLDDSVLIVRQDGGGVRAFFNACRHRGMPLASGQGSVSEFRCPFHAWTYGRDGKLLFALSPDEFPCAAEYALGECAVDTWAGFVFVNMDPSPPPLLEYLGPVVEELGKYHFENMQLTRWHTSPFPCNWKLAIESFIEIYHVAGTHPQTLPVSDDVNAKNDLMGIHSRTISELLVPSPRLGDISPDVMLSELIKGFADFGMTDMLTDIELPDLATFVLPEDGNLQPLFETIQRQIAQKRGVDLSEFSREQLVQSHIWLAFPNLCIQAVSATEALIWLMRPNGHDPDSCFIDEIILTPPPAGSSRQAAPRKFASDWREHQPGLALEQDWLILEQMQQGLKQRTHEGQLLADRQESRISHFHAVIDRFVGGEEAPWKSAD